MNKFLILTCTLLITSSLLSMDPPLSKQDSSERGSCANEAAVDSAVAADEKNLAEALAAMRMDGKFLEGIIIPTVADISGYESKAEEAAAAAIDSFNNGLDAYIKAVTFNTHPLRGILELTACESPLHKKAFEELIGYYKHLHLWILTECTWAEQPKADYYRNMAEKIHQIFVQSHNYQEMKGKERSLQAQATLGLQAQPTREQMQEWWLERKNLEIGLKSRIAELKKLPQIHPCALDEGLLLRGRKDGETFVRMIKLLVHGTYCTICNYEDVKKILQHLETDEKDMLAFNQVKSYFSGYLRALTPLDSDKLFNERNLDKPKMDTLRKIYDMALSRAIIFSYADSFAVARELLALCLIVYEL